MKKIIVPIEKIEHEILNHFVDEFDITDNQTVFEHEFDFSHMGNNYKIFLPYEINNGQVHWERHWLSAKDDSKKEVEIYLKHINYNPEAETLQNKIDVEMRRKEWIEEENKIDSKAIEETNNWLNKNL